MQLLARLKVGRGASPFILTVSCLTAAALLGTVLPPETYVISLVGLAAVVAAVAGVVVQTRQPYWGLSALIVTAVLVPMERPPLNLVLPLAMFVCACGAAEFVVVHGLRARRLSRAALAALALIAITSVSFAVGQAPWFPSPGAPLPAQLGGLAMFVVSGGLFLVVGYQIRSLNHLKGLVWLFLVTGAVVCISQTVPSLDLFNRVIAPQSIGSLFWTWLVAVGASQSLLNRDLAPLTRVFLGGVAGMVLFRGFVLAGDWTSGWLPPLVALGVVLLYRWPRATVGLALLSLPVGLYFATTIVGAMAHESYSYVTRLAAWQAIGDVIEKNPLLGLGPANYYYYTPFVPILGWYVKFASHNQYLDLIAQIGLLGFLAFGWLVAEVGRMTLQLRQRLAPGFSRAYLTGVLAGVAGTLVAGMLADWIIPFVYGIAVAGLRSSLLFWFFIGGVLAIHRIIEHQDSHNVGALPGLRS